MGFRLVIPAFPEGALIPPDYTCQGQDVSPAIDWFDPPQGVESYALILDDPDAPGGTWNHWLLWDIPASKSGFEKGFPVSGKMGIGTNDFGKAAYAGPCPPHGHGSHRYYFRLYAIDVETLGLPRGAKRAGLDHAVHAHLIDAAYYMGRYERRQ